MEEEKSKEEGWSVLKFTVEPEHGITKVEMPKGSRILWTQAQYSKVALWALCQPNGPKSTRHIRVALTGIPLYNEEPMSLVPIGVCFFAERSFVVHVFEVV